LSGNDFSTNPARDTTRRASHPTLAEVAADARVSLSTASRALRDGSSVSEKTRRRVRAAASELGYGPNRLARSLRTRSSTLVGAIVPDVAIGFYARAVKGAQDALEREGYQLLVMNTEREASRERAALRMLLEHRVDGILIATSGGFEASPRVPVVFFDNLVGDAGAGHVALANRQGMALLVGHLVGHGHRRIAYVGAPPVATSGVERLAGFEEALAATGVEPRPEYVAPGDEVWSAESGRRAAGTLLALRDPPTALVAASDTLALGAISAAREAGLRVPEDVAVVSFDDPFFGDLIDPPMTALARRERELGELAASVLLHALRTGIAGPPADIRLPVELIVRRSCGCGAESEASER
jgi:LacI family transcriptional regulator